MRRRVDPHEGLPEVFGQAIWDHLTPYLVSHSTLAQCAGLELRDQSGSILRGSSGGPGFEDLLGLRSASRLPRLPD